MNGGVNVLLHDAAADDDGIFEVVAVPWHERDEHVLAQGKLTLVGARAVSDDITLLDFLTTLHEWLLVDAGAGIAAAKLAQRIDVDALVFVGLYRLDRVFEEFFILDGQIPVLGDDDHIRRGGGDGARTVRDDHGTRITCRFAFHAGADER